MRRRYSRDRADRVAAQQFQREIAVAQRIASVDEGRMSFSSGKPCSWCGQEIKPVGKRVPPYCWGCGQTVA